MMHQQVNLYTEELRPRKVPLQVSSLVLAVIAACVVIVAITAYTRYDLVLKQQAQADLNQRQAQLQKQVEELAGVVASQRIDPSLEPSIDAVTADIGRHQRLLAEVARLVSDDRGVFSPYMEAMARQVPADLWLTGFRLNLNTDRVRLSGRARSGAQVPLYLERLGQEPVFRGRIFEHFSLDRDDSDRWIDFRVATERGPEEGS